MILERNVIELSSIQQKMLVSAWGEDAIKNAVVEKISYESDGYNVKGFLGYPKNIDGKLPCIIWCRGGFGNAGALDEFNAQGILGQLAGWGYVVFESQYRGNDGGEGKDEFGGEDLNDILNLIPLAEEIEFADNQNWGIEGWSRGGMMTYLTLTRSDLFKAAVSTGGISNLNCTLDESNFMKKLINFNQSELNSEFCKSRTILEKMDKYSRTTPTLLLHGTHDTRVPAHHSLDLSYKFLNLGIEHKLVLFEKGDHFLKHHKIEVDRIRKNWFSKYLK